MPRFAHLMLLSVAACFGLQSLRAEEATEQKKEQIAIFGVATLDVPAEFKRAAKASRIIEHEFQATAGEGDESKSARVTMMAAGGDVEANIERWKGQFSGTGKRDKTDQMKLGDWQVYLVDVGGTYDERMGGPFAGGRVVQHKDYAMTGAILVHPEGRKYFVKMIGPETVVKANRERFVKMIKSIED